MSTVAKILIVEDEYITAKTIANFLSSNGYEVIGCALNVKEALSFLESESIDCVILDINLNDEKDGIWIGNHIQENYHIPFIYLTAYTDHKTLSAAITTSPYGFLNKPFQKPELFSSIEIALLKHNSLMSLKEEDKQQTEKNKSHIFLKNVDRYEKVFWSEISHIESQRNYLLLYTLHKTYKHRATIKEFVKVLPKEKFIQVHRAFIVNVDKINSYTKTEIEINQNKIPISKSYKADLMSSLES